jgi:tRNA-splicing endonuclease subunit Sen2
MDDDVVPVVDASEFSTSEVYHGELRGGAVWVSDPVAMLALSRGGFGKGALSRTQPECTKGPEHLVLMLEEAFFLAWAAQCLVVREMDGVAVELTQSLLWARCRTLQDTFVARYAAYHHCRAQGWLPKSGLKVGVDFVLYPLSTHLAHATYAAIVQAYDPHPLIPTGSTTSSSSEESATQGSGSAVAAALPTSGAMASWLALQHTLRVTTSVNKTLVVCQVVLPDLVLNDTPVETYLGAVRIHLLSPQRWSCELGRDGRALAVPMEL